MELVGSKSMGISVNLTLLMVLATQFCCGQYLNNCEMSGYRKNSKKGLSVMELMGAKHELRTILIKLAESDDGPFYRIGAIYGGTEQLVAGSIKTLAVSLLDFSSVKHNCEVDLWTRPWLTDGTDVTIRCECMRTVFKHVEY